MTTILTLSPSPPPSQQSHRFPSSSPMNLASLWSPFHGFFGAGEVVSLFLFFFLVLGGWWQRWSLWGGFRDFFVSFCVFFGILREMACWVVLLVWAVLGFTVFFFFEGAFVSVWWADAKDGDFELIFDLSVWIVLKFWLMLANLSFFFAPFSGMSGCGLDFFLFF